MQDRQRHESGIGHRRRHSVDGAAVYYWIDPIMRVAGVIMMQILPFADREALKIYRQFEHGICRALRQS